MTGIDSNISWVEFDPNTNQFIRIELDGQDETITLETVKRAIYAAGISTACIIE